MATKCHLPLEGQPLQEQVALGSCIAPGSGLVLLKLAAQGSFPDRPLLPSNPEEESCASARLQGWETPCIRGA